VKKDEGLKKLGQNHFAEILKLKRIFDQAMAKLTEEEKEVLQIRCWECLEKIEDENEESKIIKPDEN
jgi:hypothetical protein